MMTHDWPGNVRELRNLAERYVLLGGDAAFHQQLPDTPSSLNSSMSLAQRVEFFESSLIQEALANHKGCIKDCMAELALPRKTLYDKMKKYNLERKEYVD